MNWKDLFNVDYDLQEKLALKVIAVFEDELGKDMDGELVLATIANALMSASIGLGMKAEDFSDMLDAINDEYTGW